MTGYGKAETVLESGKLSVEIRSLNGKNADISLKTTLLPKDKELYVRQMVADELKRGSIDIFITFEANAAESAKKINQELVMEYFRQIDEISSSITRKFPNISFTDSSYILQSILRFPDVLDMKKADIINDGNWPAVEACIREALEKTNEAYALAKISGLKYCEYLNRQYGTDYISVMPTNLYGPNDNYHPTHSHVLPALIRRFHEAKEQNLPYVTCWGDGSPLREFLYVDDLANLCVFLMNHYSGNETVNAGTGKELTIKELTELVAKVIGYTGEIRWDPTKPNGTPRKLLDVSKATALGWTYKTELEEGIRLTYQDFLTNPMRAER